jgi:hypothetical protein
MQSRRRDRVRASQRALVNTPRPAAQRALRMARAQGRTYPTSGQRARALRPRRGG